MSKLDPSQIQWRDPWYALPSEEAHKAEKELRFEVSGDHILFQRSITALGRRQDCDVFLFHLEGGPPSFAVVHLTYQSESRPEWPHTKVFDSLAVWLEECMIPDAEEFER